MRKQTKNNRKTLTTLSFTGHKRKERKEKFLKEDLRKKFFTK